VIRVLIVDDSATTRALVRVVLEASQEIEVIGEAVDGSEAVDQAALLRPDVITMDVNMPVMNGYDATLEIMRTNPTPIVVLTSLRRDDLIHEGLDILLAGALDIVEKPSALAERDYRVVGEELVAKIKAVAGIRLTA
jgi:two-component system chemotaxis response regulator CheB